MLCLCVDLDKLFNLAIIAPSIQLRKQHSLHCPRSFAPMEIHVRGGNLHEDPPDIDSVQSWACTAIQASWLAPNLADPLQAVGGQGLLNLVLCLCSGPWLESPRLPGSAAPMDPHYHGLTPGTVIPGPLRVTPEINPEPNFWPPFVHMHFLFCTITGAPMKE